MVVQSSLTVTHVKEAHQTDTNLSSNFSVSIVSHNILYNNH